MATTIAFSIIGLMALVLTVLTLRDELLKKSAK